MSESDASVQLFRFTCPACGKVLKARMEWAGKRGVCPSCQTGIVFPKAEAVSGRSRTAQQLKKLMGEDDNVTMDEGELDRLSLLLSQGTCRDYGLAEKLLGERPLSPKQWRFVLSSAAVREHMRLHIEEQLERMAEIPDDDSSEEVAAEGTEKAVDPNAWTMVVRYLYFLRHGTCEKCAGDVTGLSCMYLRFEGFLEMRKVTEDRAGNWRRICHHYLGV